MRSSMTSGMPASVMLSLELGWTALSRDFGVKFSLRRSDRAVPSKPCLLATTACSTLLNVASDGEQKKPPVACNARFCNVRDGYNGLPVTLCGGCSSGNGKFDVGDGEFSSGVRSEVEDMETLGVASWLVCVKRARAPSNSFTLRLARRYCS